MKFANATKSYRKSGEAEGSAVQRTFPGYVFSRERSVAEGPAVSFWPGLAFATWRPMLTL
jgi:hypothetical protein